MVAIMRTALTIMVSVLALEAFAPGEAAAQTSTPAAPPADMAMPDDLGAPLAGAPVQPAVLRPDQGFRVTMPIGLIASSPQGRAVLDRDLPGLCERPEFMMFKGMSPIKLASMSHGRITPADLDKLQGDLNRIGPGGAPVHSYSIFTRSSRTVTRFSKAVYHRVALMIALL